MTKLEAILKNATPEEAERFNAALAKFKAKRAKREVIYAALDSTLARMEKAN